MSSFITPEEAVIEIISRCDEESKTRPFGVRIHYGWPDLAFSVWRTRLLQTFLNFWDKLQDFASQSYLLCLGRL